MASAFPATERDIFVLGATIFLEARGEPAKGRLAVGFVARNRAQYVLDHPRQYKIFGNGTIQSACLFPYQFSCWNKNSTLKALADSLKPEMEDTDRVFSACMAVARDVVGGTVSDPSEGSLWYYAPSSGLPWPKGWGPQVKPKVIIKNHHFFDRLAE